MCAVIKSYQKPRNMRSIYLNNESLAMTHTDQNIHVFVWGIFSSIYIIFCTCSVYRPSTQKMPPHHTIILFPPASQPLSQCQKIRGKWTHSEKNRWEVCWGRSGWAKMCRKKPQTESDDDNKKAVFSMRHTRTHKCAD